MTKCPNAAQLVIKWIKETYKLPEAITFTILRATTSKKWWIVVTEDWGAGYDIDGYRTASAHHFNLLAWDGEQGFIGTYFRRHRPLYVSDPKFFDKLRKTIINPTFKNYLYFPSNVFYAKPRSKI